MSAVQPPPDAADDDPILDGEGRVIDLPAGALSSTRTARGRTSRPSRSSRPSAGLGAALDASLADVSAAAERLAGGGGVAPVRPAAPRASRPAAPAPAARAPQPRPRAVPRPPAWQPVPWAEASARAARPAPPVDQRQPQPRAAAPDPRPQSPVRTAITLPFPVQRTRQGEQDEPARLRGVDREPLPARTVPAWLLAVMVVAVAAVACLAAYLLLRP
jgi:hypothetical protein